MVAVPEVVQHWPVGETAPAAPAGAEEPNTPAICCDNETDPLTRCFAMESKLSLMWLNAVSAAVSAFANAPVVGSLR